MTISLDNNLRLANATPSKNGVIDNFAIITGSSVLTLGLLQLVGPLSIHSIIALGDAVGSDIIAAQWIIFGLVLIFGGVTRMRTVSIFASEFLLLASGCAVAVLILHDAGLIPAAIQIAIALLAFLSSGLARLSDKAELKRDLKITREQASAFKAAADHPDKGKWND